MLKLVVLASVKYKQERGIEYTPYFLNSTDDLPIYDLKLKNNTMIMLLLNLDTSEGMCDGTCLGFTDLYKKVIKAKL
jgi:hypothetical protein